MAESGALLAIIVAEGDYELESPAHFGGGEADHADMALLRDALGAVVIPGAGVAGAARAALGARLLGWREHRDEEKHPEPEAVEHLFGGGRSDNQSALLVDDARLEEAPTLVRDGVAIDPDTGTARKGELYNLEALPPGTKFPLRLELVLRHGMQEEMVRSAFFTVLEEFRNPDWPICLGARTRRGFGRGRVVEWRVRAIDFTSAADTAWWLLSPDRKPATSWTASPGDLLSEDRRSWCDLRLDLVQRSAKSRCHVNSRQPPNQASRIAPRGRGITFQATCTTGPATGHGVPKRQWNPRPAA